MLNVTSMMKVPIVMCKTWTGNRDMKVPVVMCKTWTGNRDMKVPVVMCKTWTGNKDMKVPVVMYKTWTGSRVMIQYLLSCTRHGQGTKINRNVIQYYYHL